MPEIVRFRGGDGAEMLVEIDRRVVVERDDRDVLGAAAISGGPRASYVGALGAGGRAVRATRQPCSSTPPTRPPPTAANPPSASSPPRSGHHDYEGALGRPYAQSSWIDASNVDTRAN